MINLESYISDGSVSSLTLDPDSVKNPMCNDRGIGIKDLTAIIFGDQYQ